MRFYTPLSVLVPAGTPSSAPVLKPWTLYPGLVHGFRIDIPSGHAGLTGIRLVYQQRPIVPFDLTAYLIGNGATFQVPYEDQIMDRGLQAAAFNTDIYDHTFYLWADVDPHLPGEPPPGAIPPSARSAALGNLAAVGRLANTA